ncbi:hypothetical protein A2154_03450 [Candidatus Gottesmanbacteria bacterium RBG_16_43_7]|uniref:Fibronectin type-III domain-containing protein n=1 Tax=Candidatus Gottesmanbacteria bacterium RBG_16_43_7 TaxID=1798373 RepID=A0A1F5ZA14_9BACT|nr:MAG: hypothetical protein A2154_03450 [Candidatus Gottesmanbacteria bacterium RBG_16_43_7]
MRLTWTTADKATTYALSYGTDPGKYIYGVTDTGNVTAYTVGSLNDSQTYYFTVRAINGCMPGDPSNQQPEGEIQGTGIGGGEVLGATTLANTGPFSESLFISVFVTGLYLLATAVYGLYKEAKKIFKKK